VVHLRLKVEGKNRIQESEEGYKNRERKRRVDF
jgi:hypothetical protein